MNTMATSNKRIHPHKFTLWVAMASIVMMFAGLTSAYIVKRNQVNWQGFDLPQIFTYSTVVILLSSLLVQLAYKSFVQRNLAAYRRYLVFTAVAGVAFITMQFLGFQQLNERGIKMIGAGSNVAGSFIAVIAGLHMLHVLGGIIALIVMLRLAFGRNFRSYNAVPVSVATQYWHFVDLLWLYLFIFLQLVS